MGLSHKALPIQITSAQHMLAGENLERRANLSKKGHGQSRVLKGFYI
jgi:hypothetical protein